MTEQLTPLPPGGAPTRAGLTRALGPFRHPGYRRLALSLVLQTFAAGVWVVGVVWEVIRLGGGPTQLSLVTTAGAVGVVIPALLAGVVADRVPQKTILLVCTAVELIGMALVAVLSLSDLTQLWHLAVVSFTAGVALAFYYPAYSSWLPSLVPEDDLLAVNGFEGMVRPTMGQALGPAVAGAVVGWATSGAAIGVAALAALGGWLALTAVPKTAVRRDLSVEDPGAHPVRAALRDIGEGFAYMWRTPWLLATLLFASILCLSVLGPLEVLVPFLIKDRLGGDSTDHAFVLAAFGIGGALGALVVAALPMPRRYLTLMNLTWGLGCLPFLAIGFATAVWQVILAAFFIGVTFSAPMVIWGTLLQRRVPADLLGRVSSLDFFVSVSLLPVSMAVAGPLAELIGMRTTFVISAVLPGVVALIAVVWARLPADELAHPLS